MWSAKCPKCGAKILLEDANAKVIQCASCGAQVRVNINVNYNYSKSEYTEHIVDDAKIKAAEAANRFVGIFASPFEEHRAKKEHQRRMDEEARRAQEEQAREWRRQAHENAQRRAKWCEENVPKAAHYAVDHKQEILLAIIVVILLFLSIGGFLLKLSDRNAKRAADSLAARTAAGEVQLPASSFSGDYRTALRDLKNAGFTNISAEGAGDLYLGFLNKENDIIEVTVDGAPDFAQGDWYPNDVPIVISYHSFSKSPSDSQAATSIAAAAISESEDVCYGIRYDDHIECYWITPSEKLVRNFTYYDNGAVIGFLGHITSGSLNESLQIHFNYLFGDIDGMDETLVITEDGLVVTETDGSSTTYPSQYTVESVRDIYRGRYADLPEGINVADYFAEQAASEASASSTADLSASSYGVGLTTDALDRAVTYEMAYVLDHGSYSTCYYIDFPNDRIYYFSYGNGDETAMVAHITSGNYEKGITVHYKYAPGWDETMTFSDGSMTLTDAYGTRYTFSEADPSKIKRILNARTIISEG